MMTLAAEYGRRAPRRSPANFLGDLARARDVLQISDSATLAAVMDLLVPGGGDEDEPLSPRYPPSKASRRVDLSRGPDSAGSGRASPAESIDWDAAVGHDGPGSDGLPAAPSPMSPVRPSKWSAMPVDEVPSPGLPELRSAEAVPPSLIGRRLDTALFGRRPRATPAGGLGIPMLFRPGTARHILGAALSVSVAEGDVDVDSAAAMVAARKPLTTIPRKRLFTTRFGAQVLLDVGPGMQPFYSDVARLPQILASIMGPGLVVLRFDTFPLDGAGPRGRPWPDYQPPPAGTPVLVVTGFGIGGVGAPRPASVAKWAEFVRLLDRAGCRPLALVPGSADKVDRGLSALMPVLPWDRMATVSVVRDSFRRLVRR
jgi:hypothetical protein